jgi:hypothetical protein
LFTSGGLVTAGASFTVFAGSAAGSGFGAFAAGSVLATFGAGAGAGFEQPTNATTSIATQSRGWFQAICKLVMIDPLFECETNAADRCWPGAKRNLYRCTCKATGRPTEGRNSLTI